MNIDGEYGASWQLANILEVDDDQYDPNVRLAHLNQACSLLARRYDTRLNQVVADIDILAGDEYFLISRLNSPGKTADVVVGNLWFNPSDSNSPIIGGDFVELLNEYGDREGTVVEGYSQFNDRIYIRPVPTQACVIRAIANVVPGYISNGSNDWLSKAPWAVIYRAAEIGCTHVGQGSRISEFKTNRMEEMEAFNISDQSRYDTPMVSEDPG